MHMTNTNRAGSLAVGARLTMPGFSGTSTLILV